MCGIAGIIHRDAERPIAPAVLDAMTDTLRHRGPDGRGTRIWRNVGFGHRRLAIIDRETGAQPMGRDGFWVTYDGEFYNYKETAGSCRARSAASPTRRCCSRSMRVTESGCSSG